MISDINYKNRAIYGIIFNIDMKEKNIFKRFDNYVLNLINGRMKTRFFDYFFPKFTKLAGVKFLSLLIIVLYFVAKTNEEKSFAIELGLAQLLTGIVVHLIKFLAKRVRPYDLLEGLNTFDIFLPDYSFPSGHTAAAFSLVLITHAYFPISFLVLIFFAALIGMSRIYLAVHFPTDVLMGMIVGIIVTTVGHLFIAPGVLEYFHLN